LPKENEKRFTFNAERVQYWLSTGAQPSDTAARFLRIAGVIKTKPNYQPKAKGTGSKKEAAAS
jgi:small subunit ribosomal protein S16